MKVSLKSIWLFMKYFANRQGWILLMLIFYHLSVLAGNKSQLLRHKIYAQYHLKK